IAANGAVQHGEGSCAASYANHRGRERLDANPVPLEKRTIVCQQAEVGLEGSLAFPEEIIVPKPVAVPSGSGAKDPPFCAQALASQSMANPVECRESEYLDNHGKCSPCKECGPGFELSKECGYGEGRGAECSPCQPRRFKDNWGVHGCKSCVSCALINRAQKSNCSATSDATCGGCFPGKTRSSSSYALTRAEQACLVGKLGRGLSRIGLEENSTDPVQDPALVVLTSSALVLLVLVLLTVAVLYCQQFWKSQCQHVFLKSQTVSGQRGTFRTSGLTGFHELPPDACSLDVKNFRSPYRSTEGFAPVSGLPLAPSGLPEASWVELGPSGPERRRGIISFDQFQFSIETDHFHFFARLRECRTLNLKAKEMLGGGAAAPSQERRPVRALQLIPGVDVSGSHLPHPQPDTDSSRLMIVTSENPPARSPLETRPVMGASGLQSYSFPGGFSKCREARSRGPDRPAQPSSCARESQHCWPHTPVECTELDLQAFSAWAGKGTAKTETPGKQTLSPEVLPWSACPAAQPGLSLEAASVPCSSFQNPTLESGEILQTLATLHVDVVALATLVELKRLRLPCGFCGIVRLSSL
ncbi:hypothetical protein Chor_004356, partial [Crotalus horridus]